MNNIGEKYLPIGTVVMLKGASKRLMITGFCSMATDDTNTMFDYSGCMYPEGFLSSDQTALFNHSQIAQVYHMGLVDDEEKKFKVALNTLVSQMPNNGIQEVKQPVAPVQAQTMQQPVPPVGPGLPGYVAPQVPTNTEPTQSVVPNFRFDENGVVTGVN